jgi:hypothetical protein
MSWGGRLGFGIGELAPQRVLSLVIGGQQPYRWPDSPLTRLVTDGLIEAQTQGMEGSRPGDGGVLEDPVSGSIARSLPRQ